MEAFLASDTIDIPSLWHQDPVRRRILVALNMDTVVGHVSRFVRRQNTEQLQVCFDPDRAIGSTASIANLVHDKALSGHAEIAYQPCRIRQRVGEGGCGYV